MTCLYSLTLRSLIASELKCLEAKNVSWGGSPGLVVMGRDSHSEGRGFESWHHILDGCRCSQEMFDVASKMKFAILNQRNVFQKFFRIWNSLSVFQISLTWFRPKRNTVETKNFFQPSVHKFWFNFCFVFLLLQRGARKYHCPSKWHASYNDTIA